MPRMEALDGPVSPVTEPEPVPGPPDCVRTVWYTYYANGPVSNITVRDLSDRFVRRDQALYYNCNGQL
ncbi:MAG: hypothetical protein KKB50_05750 [Planctomycetes bacterium]|nr:hypothetical protein [Planctomycetota bacterium]